MPKSKKDPSPKKDTAVDPAVMAPAVEAGWNPADGAPPYKHGVMPVDAALPIPRTGHPVPTLTAVQPGDLWSASLGEMQSDVGFVDNDDVNPWTEEQGAGDAAYCCAFACIVPFHQGYLWPDNSQFGQKGDAYVPYRVTHAIEQGEWQEDHASTGSPADVRPGDQVVYVWPGGDRRGDHIETCIATLSDGSTLNIGANTYAYGGHEKGVWQVRRDREFLFGRIRPQHYYDSTVPEPPPAPPQPPAPPVPPTGDWTEELIMALEDIDLSNANNVVVTGYLVDNLQGLLKATQRPDCDPGEIDGQGGGLTRQAVLNFQRVAGLSVDGVVGRETWSRLIKW